jgi:hypothetical protein
MHAHEVMKDVLKRISAKQISSEMGVSLSLVYKWAEPPEEDSGSGASSPLHRVGQLVRISKDVRLAQWVCEQGDGFFIRNPRTEQSTDTLRATNDIVQEFADMLATIARATADHTITKEEARTIRRRWEELKSVTERFVKTAESGSYGPPGGESPAPATEGAAPAGPAGEAAPAVTAAAAAASTAKPVATSTGKRGTKSGKAARGSDA